MNKLLLKAIQKTRGVLKFVLTLILKGKKIYDENDY